MTQITPKHLALKAMWLNAIASRLKPIELSPRMQRVHELLTHGWNYFDARLNVYRTNYGSWQDQRNTQKHQRERTHLILSMMPKALASSWRRAMANESMRDKGLKPKRDSVHQLATQDDALELFTTLEQANG